MGQQPLYGGQAVIEGVMMQGPGKMAIAVRRPDGTIAIHEQKIQSLTERYPVLRLPILRGMVVLVETISRGITALMYSANQAVPDEEQLSRGEMTLSTLLGVVGAIALFVVLPTLITHWMGGLSPNSAVVHLLEGLMRFGIFIGYLWSISLVKEIQRVFQYHGAEHKVINTLEAGDPLTVECARRHSREHRRCGTSFLLYVVVISILLFSLVNIPNVALRIVSRIALLPLVAGVSYEIIRLLGRYSNRLTLAISRPGMWLQGLTTREPDDSQLEVAIAALQAAMGQPRAATEQ